MAEHEFTIVRVFDAPRELVFRAWTDPEHMPHWWGPAGFTTPASTIEVDLRPGGEWRATMIRDSDGFAAATGGIYREVVPPERLVFTWADPSAPAAAVQESVVTITLVDVGGKTEMTFHQAGFEAGSDVQNGWTSCIARLATYLGRMA